MNHLVFLAYAGLVTWGSLRPMQGVSIEPWDKLVHLLMYAVFALLGYRIARTRRAFSWLCAGIVGYSGLMEFGQSFVPGRAMDGYDMLFNTIGVALAWLLATHAHAARKAAR